MKRDAWTVDIMSVEHELSDGMKVRRDAETISFVFNPENVETFNVRRTPGGSEVITNPGRFEGEETFVMIAHEAMLNGVADDHADGSFSVKVEAGDKVAFPALSRRQRIRARVTDQGFVVQV